MSCLWHLVAVNFLYSLKFSLAFFLWFPDKAHRGGSCTGCLTASGHLCGVPLDGTKYYLLITDLYMPVSASKKEIKYSTNTLK
jgi:hypothetical protein